jgi:hypothetical protein
MSMVGEYVEISADDLELLIARPEGVSVLFGGGEGDGGEAEGDALRAYMRSRSAHPGGADGIPRVPVRARLSLDTAWHGVHYLLSGTANHSDTPPGRAVLGGIEIGDDDGHGPARYFTAAQVAAVAAALAESLTSGDAARRFDPRAMTMVEIYPGAWDDDARDRLLESLTSLSGFFSAAAARGSAIITAIV